MPRETTQWKLAEELGIQSSSTSETLRRAMGELIANTLLEKETVREPQASGDLPTRRSLDGSLSH